MYISGLDNSAVVAEPWAMSAKDGIAPASLPEAEEQTDSDPTDFENGDDWDKKSGNAARCITLQSLLGAGVLEPGEGAMTIDYLGQKFTGDLLLDGKIKSQETEKIYGSPTAWAVSCKKVVNPVKQSGCGWATVRYKGTKLDAFKNLWIKKQYEEGNFAYDFMEAFAKNMMSDGPEPKQEVDACIKTEVVSDPETDAIPKRLIVRHGSLVNRQHSHDQNVLVESVTFASLGKIQPFHISMTSNAALVVDFHCHLTTSEVVGYLAGTWDVNSHVLTVSHAFPVRCRLGDFEAAPIVEAETLHTIRSHGLTLLGWYHSHPHDPPEPSLKDIDAQLDYELRMKGASDSAYLPCVGLICSPYNIHNPSMESQMAFYWVAPPPESRIHEYGKPMTMHHVQHQEESIPHEVLMEMKKCADFYRRDSDYVVFDDVYKSDVTYLTKFKLSVIHKFPRNLAKGEDLWNCLSAMATSPAMEEPDTALLKDMLAISNTPSLSPEVTQTIPHPLPLPISALSPLAMHPSKPSRSSPTPPHTPPASRRRRASRESKSTPTSTPPPNFNNYLVGSDLASALLGASMGLDPTTLSLLNLNALGLGGMFMHPLAGYKHEPNVGLMKPPPPPSPYYPYAQSRGTRSRSSSSPSSTHRNSSASTIVKDMPPPNKVPKIENNYFATNNSAGESNAGK